MLPQAIHATYQCCILLYN